MRSNYQASSIKDTRTRLLALACMLLAACSTGPIRQSPSADLSDAAIGVKPVAEDRDLPLQLLDGQFKLQAGDIKGGSQAYVRAALLSDDPQLAEQATQLALISADWDGAERAAKHWQKLAPMSDGVTQARGWVALGRSDSAKAEQIFSMLLAKSGSKGWQLLGQALLAVPDKPKSAELLSRLATPERLGDDETTWVAMSQLAFKLGDKRRAQDLSDQAVVRFHGVESTAWNAQMALDRGDGMMARDIFGEGLRQQPESARLRVGYAALLAELGDEPAAAKVLAEGKQDDLTYSARMAYAVRTEDRAALAKIYKEVQADKAPNTPARVFLLGQLSELNESYDEAATWYRKVPIENQRWFDAQLRLAVALDQGGKTAEALQVARRLESEAGIDNEAVGKVFLLEADLLKRHGRNAEARNVYDRAIEFLPDDTRLLYSRALIAASSNEIEVAEADLRKVIEQEPENAAALNALGYTLADQTDRLDEALELIEQAYKLNPDEPSIIDSLGWVQFRLGRTEEAVVTLKRAYEKFADPEVASHYAQALWATGRRELASKVLSDALENSPGDAQLLATQKRLKP